MGRRVLLPELGLEFWEQCESHHLILMQTVSGWETYLQALRQKYQRKYCTSWYDRERFDCVSFWRSSKTSAAKHRCGGETRYTNLQLCVICWESNVLGKIHWLEHPVWLRVSFLKCYMVSYSATKWSKLKNNLPLGTFASSWTNLHLSTSFTRYSCTWFLHFLLTSLSFVAHRSQSELMMKNLIDSDCSQ